MSDPLGILASAVETLNWNGSDADWILERILEICKTHSVERIVLGLPKRTDGKTSETAEKARLFGDELASLTGLPVIYQDERYTTVIASRILKDSHVKGKNKRGVIDQVAAEIILQSYLDEQR